MMEAIAAARAQLRPVVAGRALAVWPDMTKRGRDEHQSIVAAVIGVVLLAAAVASDFADRRFWDRHAMLTSLALAASLLVVVITVAVVNEAVERRGAPVDPEVELQEHALRRVRSRHGAAV